MEISKQIKKCRGRIGLSQEQLAEKIYVTRQTVSNWETEKSYPDIHSLLAMSLLFDISLDELVKGDLEMMQKEIKKVDTKGFDRKAVMLFVAMFLVLAVLPLYFLIDNWLWLIEVPLIIWMLVLTIQVEKFKDKLNIHTYREIVAFTNGTPLDEIAKQRRKRRIPVAISTTIGFIAAFAAGILIVWLIKHVL
ncbi:MAG: helix-turn-helix domain-containing protein [Streptococcaceae bacterium]|jgi:transcriptional regulator with XRE-family HTH domain|nr:helix-turn-helix domain-containing protein [Streptococcaceae bacterium]